MLFVALCCSLNVCVVGRRSQNIKIVCQRVEFLRLLRNRKTDFSLRIAYFIPSNHFVLTSEQWLRSYQTFKKKIEFSKKKFLKVSLFLILRPE